MQPVICLHTVCMRYLQRGLQVHAHIPQPTCIQTTTPMDVAYTQTHAKYILLTVACMQSSDDIAQAHLWLQR